MTRSTRSEPDTTGTRVNPRRLHGLTDAAPLRASSRALPAAQGGASGTGSPLYPQPLPDDGRCLAIGRRSGARCPYPRAPEQRLCVHHLAFGAIIPDAWARDVPVFYVRAND